MNVPQHHDPIARLALFALVAVLAGALFVPAQPVTTAAAQPIVILSTVTPAIVPLASEVMPTAAPVEAAPTALPIIPAVEVARIYPATATPISTEPPPPAIEVASAPETAPAAPPPIDAALNDPAQNGGSIPDPACPFPIRNGVCGDGNPAPPAQTEFGSKPGRDIPPKPTAAPLPGGGAILSPGKTKAQP